MSSKGPFLHASDNLGFAPVRATFIPTHDGLKLCRVSAFSSRKFLKPGWEVCKEIQEACVSAEAPDEIFSYIPDDYLQGIEATMSKDIDDETAKRYHAINLRRAQRRARLHALDLIMCNSQLDTFCTFTYAPSDNLDRVSYDECYSVLKPWLSNRVTRRGLSYVCATEKQKKGGIHFHMLANSEALKLEAAHSPYTGKPLMHGSKPLFNVSDWKHGFSSAESVSGEDASTKVAKYIFKYMAKNDTMIGGRYFLHGGKLAEPVYCYGESVDEFVNGEPTFEKNVNIGDHITYRELSFM